MQHARKECWNLDEKLLLFASLWRGLLGAPNMDFMTLKNESTLAMLSVEIFTEIIYWSEYLCQSGSCSSTKRLRRNVVLYWSPALRQWCGVYATSPSAEIWLNSLAFDTCLASGLMPGTSKVRIVQFRDSGLSHFCVRNRRAAILSEWGSICA